MPSKADTDAFGDSLASHITAADATAPAIPATDNMAFIEAFAIEILRPYQMRNGFAKAFAAALDPPWVNVEATNSSNAEAAKLGTGWFNKAPEWALAMIRKVPLTGTVELRGYVYAASASNTLILTLPPPLRPAKNELFATVIDLMPAYINVWIDGTVSVWQAEATTRQFVTLSGISFDAAL